MKFLDGQFEELRIVQPQPRPEDSDLLDRVHVKISADVLQTRSRWRRFFGLGFRPFGLTESRRSCFTIFAGRELETSFGRAFPSAL